MWQIREEDIILDQSFETAQEAIFFAGVELVKRGYVKEDYTTAMYERHQQVSVYIGNFVALPHADEDERILNEGIVLIQVPDGVNFGTPEKRQIATIIVAVALKRWTQLTVLQELALFFSDLENVQKLSDATTRKAVLELITSDN